MNDQTNELTGNVAASVPAVSAQQQTAPDIFSPGAFEHAQRVAKVFVQSELVPPHMRTVPNALIAMQIARRLGEDLLMVAQNIYIVGGRAGWNTAYMISRANRSGVFKTRITWEEKGQDQNLSVTASAIL